MVVTSNQTAYIVVPKNASECIAYAAEELTYFLFECLGVKAQTVTDEQKIDGVFFALGETALTKAIGYAPDLEALNGDGFYIKTAEKGVYIVGAADRGVLFGVYEIVEKYLGVRFISSDTTIIPKSESLVIEDGEQCEVPAFRLRGYIEYDMYEDQSNAINQANKVFALRKRARHSFLFSGEKFGGGSQIWGRGDTHNFCFYVDKKKYNNPNDPANYHPEFYCCATDEVNKDFEFTYAGDRDTTVCLTNGITDDGKLDESMDVSVAKLVIQELKKDIVARPDVEYFAFEQEDGNLYCQCERCRKTAEKYKRSGVQIRFINAVLKELQAWSDKELNGRKIQIVTYAYGYTLDAPIIRTETGIKPIDETVIPSENIVFRLAVGRDCFFDYFEEKQRENTLKAIEEWRQIGKKFFVWTYDAFFDRHLMYMPSVHTVSGNVKGFKKFGCEYLMILGAYNSKGLWQDKMRAYVYQRALWDVNADVDALVDEFLTHYFGAVSVPYMKKYMDEYYNFYGEYEKTRRVCCTFGMRDKEQYDGAMLKRTIVLVQEAKKAVAESVQDAELRDKYDRHLTQAEVSSMFPLVENYHYHYLDKTHDDYIAYAKEFVRLCRYGEISRYAETLTIDSLVEADYKFPY